MKKLKRSMVLAVAILCGVLSFDITSFASSSLLSGSTTDEKTVKSLPKKSDEVNKTYLFAIPDNGWNSAKIKLQYFETYDPSDANLNDFMYRQRFFSYKIVGAGANSIDLAVSNFLHTDGQRKTIINDLMQGDVIFNPTEWDYCTYWFNNTSYSYSKNTNFYGQVTYLLLCPDGIPATATDSAKIDFATQ